MKRDPGQLREAYRELLRQSGAANFLQDVPDPDLLRSIAESGRKVSQEIERQMRENPGRMASPVDKDLLLQYWTGPAPKPAEIDENIIRHLALLPYPAWSHVGRESRSVLLHRLATMAQRPRVFGGLNADGYQRTLDEKQQQIETLIKSSGRAIPPAYCGLFPTGSHNAEATGVEGGTLILVNNGLMNLLYQLAKINLAAANYKTDKPLIDEVQTSVALGELLTAHTVGGSSFFARQLPPLDPGRQEIASKLTTIAEVFVIAHEYGHALAGHLEKERASVAVETPAGELMLYQQAQEEEYEADRLAIEIIGPALVMPDSPRGEAVALSAVLMFFFVDLVVWRFLGFLGRTKPPPTTHPSSEERYERARRQLAQIATSPIAFDHAQALAMWFTAREDHIVELLSDTLTMAADLGLNPSP